MARASASKRQDKNERKKPGRPIWKGTISFGLVTIPVSLYSAEAGSSLDLDLLDKRDLSPIRYRRINEKTGREVPWNENYQRL